MKSTGIFYIVGAGRTCKMAGVVVQRVKYYCLASFEMLSEMTLLLKCGRVVVLRVVVLAQGGGRGHVSILAFTRILVCFSLSSHLFISSPVTLLPVSRRPDKMNHEG